MCDCEIGVLVELEDDVVEVTTPGRLCESEDRMSFGGEHGITTWDSNGVRKSDKTVATNC